jgi:hypothetical protein
MDGHVLKIVLGPAQEENIEEILHAGKSHHGTYHPRGDHGALLLQRLELRLDVLSNVRWSLHFRTPLAAVCVSVDNGTKREGIRDKVRVSHVVQHPHLVEERVGVIGAVQIA